MVSWLRWHWHRWRLKTCIQHRRTHATHSHTKPQLFGIYAILYMIEGEFNKQLLVCYCGFRWTGNNAWSKSKSQEKVAPVGFRSIRLKTRKQKKYHKWVVYLTCYASSFTYTHFYYSFKKTGITSGVSFQTGVFIYSTSERSANFEPSVLWMSDWFPHLPLFLPLVNMQVETFPIKWVST